MSELDRIKLKISFHEKMFFSALAVLLALLGWMVLNFKSAEEVILLLAMISSVLSSGVVVRSYFRIRVLIDKVGEL
ncbi:MAG: hypothetical protein HOD58_08885 [Gammaproteobacteria bacterium]|jgi:hypothetical protein|nr:hypothetical protein [Gammaproteobacteria bacterium]